MGASIKIMLSYDYCHFEVCKSTDQDISDKEINEMRKDIQRLADESVRQYKEAKRIARINIENDEQFKTVEHLVKRYKEIPETERSPEVVAYLKEYDNQEYQKSIDYRYYDYDDDDETYDFEDDNGVI